MIIYPTSRLFFFFIYSNIIFYLHHIPSVLTLKVPSGQNKRELDIDSQTTGTYFSPKVNLQVEYGNKHVLFGNYLTTTETAERPRFYFSADRGADYTLLMLDPDAPSMTDPKWGPWRHWVVVNIPGDQDIQMNEAAFQLTSYAGPAPPPNTGDHRYIFFLYKQAKKNQTFQSLPESFDKRRNFDYKQFTATYNLELVGVNFFISKHT